MLEPAGDGEGLAATGDGVSVEPLGVAPGGGEAGDVVGDGDCSPVEAGGRANKGGVLGEGVADKEGMEEDGLWPGTLSDRPLVVNCGDKSGSTGRAEVAGGSVAGGGGGITKGDCCGNRLVVRERKDDSGGREGREGTKKGGSVEDGKRPKP